MILIRRISLGLGRLSGDSLKGAFKNQFWVLGRISGNSLKGSVWVWIDFLVILKRVLSRISLGLDRLSGDS